MKYLTAVLILLFSRMALSQDSDSISTPLNTHVYHVNPCFTGSFILATGVTDLLVLHTLRFKPGITDAEFDALNEGSINSFDRWALRQSTSNYTSKESQATIINTASVTLPLILFIDKPIGRDWGRILGMYLEVQSASLALYMLSPMGPLFQNKLRPVVYYDELSRDERRDGNNRNSFYSGHVSSVAAATFFMVKVYSDYHPEIGNDKFLLYGFAAIPPLALGYIRLLGLKHFPSDILTGFGIGALCGVLIPELHRIDGKEFSIGFYGSQESTRLSLKAGF